MDLTSTVEQKVRVTLTPKTSSGNPATLDGTPIWEIVSGGATVQNISADGLSAEIVSEDTIGSSTWKVSADADLGAGVRTIEEGGTYTYTNAEAAALGATTEILPKNA
jgi:hypothetical protein